MRVALARHDHLMQQAIAEQGGYLFKTMGDSVLSAFQTAPTAVRAALAAQQALQSEPWPAPIQIKVRMGLHTGNAEFKDGDYFGQTLNRAARLLAAGHGGQTLLSLAAQELCRDALPPEATLLSLGEHRLKDLSRPETIYQLQHPSLAETFAPLRSLDNPALPHNLPKQLTSFVGRQQEIAAVRTLLGKTRLLTLTGAGGSGKTRLSIQVAAEVLEDYPDGVWQVELAPLVDPTLVPQVVASVLGVREQPGQNLQQSLLDYGKTRRLMLLLDNTEHLLAACSQLVAALLRACPQVHVLATSREALGIAGEQVYRVPPLSLPDPRRTHPVTPDSLRQYEAVRLFQDRALLVKSDFSVTPQNAPSVALLCYRLDGIPLAIELAAARVRSLSVEDITTRLDQRFRLLTGGDRSALPRQQTLRALVDWSYDLLKEQEKALLARLSVFAGGWTLDAAESICGFDPIEDWEVLDLLTSLVDKSLVLAEEQEGEIRYRVLETLRQYGSDRLAAGEEKELVRERHREWFLKLAEEARPHLHGADQSRWLTRLETEHDNLRVALESCARQEDTAAIEGGLRLSGALSFFWAVRGYLAEGREHLEQAIERAKRSAEIVTPPSPKLLGRALAGAGSLTGYQGDFATARALHQESLTLFQDIGDKQEIAGALRRLGALLFEQGDFSAAQPLYEQSLALCRESGDQQGAAGALLCLGWVAKVQGDFAAARSLQEESLALNRTIGNKQGIANTLNILGGIASDLGDFPAARSFLEESLAIFRESGDRFDAAGALNGLGVAAWAEGDFAAARALHEESLAIRRELGSKQGIVASLYNLGLVAGSEGDYARARTLYRESLDTLGELADRNVISYLLEGLASVALGESDPRKAVILWGAAEALRESIGVPLPPSEQTMQDTSVAQTRAALSEEIFLAAREEGRSLPWEQAIAYAFEPAAPGDIK